MGDLRAEFLRRVGAGEAVAWAGRTDGAEGSILVFAAGHFHGDLGEPRLNQRAALYAEAILEKAPEKRPARQRKGFEGPEGTLNLEFEFGTVGGPG